MEGAWVLVLCRWAIGLAFTISAAGKATAMASFRGALADFGVVPDRLSGAAARTTVVAEALVAGLVAAGGRFAVAGFCLALALLAAFSATLALALRKKAAVNCNCFGPGERHVSRYDLVRNAALGMGCAGGLWGYAASSGGHPVLALVLLAGLMAAVFVVMTINLEDVVELLRKPYLFE